MAKKFISQFTSEEIDARLAAVSEKVGGSFFDSTSNTIYFFKSIEDRDAWVDIGKPLKSDLILFTQSIPNSGGSGGSGTVECPFDVVEGEQITDTSKSCEIQNAEGVTLYPKTVTDLVYDTETGEPIGEVISSARKIQADDDKKWLRVQSKSGKRYFVALTELAKPDMPTISTTTYNVVTGSVTIKVTNNYSDSTTEAKIGTTGTWGVVLNNAIVYATQFENNKENKSHDIQVLLRAIKNGETSDENSVTVRINPKVAKGAISVTRSGNNNDFSTSATVKLTPSATIGSESKYGNDVDGWTVFNAETSISVGTTTQANKYIIKATKSGYVDADSVGNSAITLNAKKAYYGGSALDTITTEEQVSQLSNPVEAYNFGGQTINLTLNEPAYVWLCCTSTIKYDQIGNKTGENSGANRIPFNSAVKAGSYNCYRSSSQWVAGNHTVWIPK